MIEKFQQLPLVTKVVVLFGGFSVVIGLLALVYFALNPANTTPTPAPTTAPATSVPIDPDDPNSPVVNPDDPDAPISTPGVDGTPTPTPTAVIPPYDDGTLIIMRPDDQAAIEAGWGLAPEDIKAAYQVANDGYFQYCDVKNAEAAEARLARLTPFFNPSGLSSANDPLLAYTVQDRDCHLGGVYPKNWDGTTLTAIVTVHMATIAPSATEGVLNTEGTVEDFAATVSLVRGSNGWLISAITDKTGAPIVSSGD